MGKRIATLDGLKREKGFLYYIKSKEDGTLEVYEAEMVRGRKKKK